MAVTSVIKYEGDNRTFIWKYPHTDFNMGSELIVRESQEAIFFYNGEILDRFTAGKHILETENLPVAKGILKLATGGRNPFVAELYFINLTEQMAIRWGTDSKVSYLDPVSALLLAAVILGERLSLWGIVGAVLILGAALVSELDPGEKNIDN